MVGGFKLGEMSVLPTMCYAEIIVGDGCICAGFQRHHIYKNIGKLPCVRETGNAMIRMLENR